MGKESELDAWRGETASGRRSSVSDSNTGAADSYLVFKQFGERESQYMGRIDGVNESKRAV